MSLRPHITKLYQSISQEYLCNDQAVPKNIRRPLAALSRRRLCQPFDLRLHVFRGAEQTKTSLAKSDGHEYEPSDIGHVQRRYASLATVSSYSSCRCWSNKVLTYRLHSGKAARHDLLAELGV